MKNLKIILILSVFLIASISSAFADNITIYDNRSSSTGWYGTQEDNEVEPGMIDNQSWDLEGFFLNGNTLSMVGGYNFKDGNQGYMSGDIFIDTTGDAHYGDDTGDNIRNGYDYVCFRQSIFMTFGNL